LHGWRTHLRPATKAMTLKIPNYDLYGDSAEPGWTNTLNFEWIPERSAHFNFHIRPHRHDAMLQVLYVIQGSGQVLLEERTWQLPAPSIAIVPAGHVHGFDFSDDVDGPVITAAQRPMESLAGLIFPQLLDTLRQPAVLPLDTGDRHVPQLLPLCRAIEREWRTSGAGQIAACQSLLLTLLIQLHRIKQTLGLGRAQPEPHGNSRRYRQVENFRALVDLHFREHLPVQWYADRMNLSASQLSRLCRESLGMGALDVIAARLMHEAQRDLVYTVDSVKAIAANLGFKNDAYFSRFFRKRTGTTPTAFRESALQAMRQST